MAQLVKSRLQCRRPQFNFWVTRFTGEGIRLPSPVSLGFPCGSAGKQSACNAGDLGSIPGLGRYPGEGKGYPLQYSALENSMDCIVHGVAKSQALLSDFHFLFQRLFAFNLFTTSFLSAWVIMPILKSLFIYWFVYWAIDQVPAMCWESCALWDNNQAVVLKNSCFSREYSQAKRWLQLSRIMVCIGYWVITG